MTEKTNDSKNLSDIVPQEAIDDIFVSLTELNTDKKRMTFYLYWLFGFPIKTCAKLSGYSESYAYNLVHAYKKSTKMQTQIDEILDLFPERYKSVCKLRLPQVAAIEAKALQIYEDDPKLAIQSPQLLRQLKQAGGVDLNEAAQPPKGITINVKEIRLLHSVLLPTPEDAEDAEIIDD